MVEIHELLDLSKTLAAELFDGKTYPWAPTSSATRATGR